jgi:putative nucleotidyltransferase with HDIG domain
VALTKGEAAAQALAAKAKWPHAVLGRGGRVVRAAPSAAWKSMVPSLGLREGSSAARWPRGRSGLVIPLADGGHLVLGPFARGTGPGPAVLAGVAALVAAERAARADLLREVERARESEAAAQNALARKEHTLEAVLHLGRTLATIRSLNELVASSMVPELVKLLNADRGSVFLIDDARQELYSVVALGAEIREIRFPLDRGLAGYVARSGEVLNVADAHQDARFNPEFDRKTGYRTKSVLAVPMLDPSGRRIGVIQVINKKTGEGFTGEDVELLEAIASEASVAILNTRLVEELRALFDSVIVTMSAALDARDQMTAGHTHRVTEYSVGIARRLGYTRSQLERVRIAGMLHDIGKIGTPDAVLKKPGNLTKEEFEIIKQHAAYTRVIVRNLKLPPELAGLADEAALHHERMDGTGYPDGLKGDRIPPVARLMAVADVFDAITSKRHYRDAMPIEQALEIIRKGTGGHFDPVCVEAFFRYFEEELKDRFSSSRDGGGAAQA